MTREQEKKQTAGKERESVIANKEEWGMVTWMDGG